MRSRDTARGRPDMTAAGDGALLARRDVITVLVVAGCAVVAVCWPGDMADGVDPVMGGDRLGVGACSDGECPTHGGRKSKPNCMLIRGRRVRRDASPQRFSKNAA